MRQRKGHLVVVHLALALAIVGALSGLVLSAQQPQVGNEASANMQVSANVIRKCLIQTQPLAFGAYDPIQANYTAPLDRQTTLTVTCTKGTAVSIAMDSGRNASGIDRRMQATVGRFLLYQVYKDSGHNEVWGSFGGAVMNAGIAPSRDPRQFTVYGRVAGGQDATEGDYQDTVLVTVQF